MRGSCCSPDETVHRGRLAPARYISAVGQQLKLQHTSYRLPACRNITSCRWRAESIDGSSSNTTQSVVHCKRLLNAGLRFADNFVNNEEYQDAVVHLMLDAYQEYKQYGHKVPASVMEACKSWVGESGSIKSHLEKEYEITTALGSVKWNIVLLNHMSFLCIKIFNNT